MKKISGFCACVKNLCLTEKIFEREFLEIIISIKLIGLREIVYCWLS